MPYYPDVVHTQAEPASVRVIPGVDLLLGTVTFIVDGELVRHWHHEPRLIADALSQSVRPARWFPATQTLSLTVAARGRQAGVEKRFSFAPSP
ncbi:hypothetical protein [Arthrobacter cavernae]|uniref:Uncharacterized protein n=1 Tax=Arthrobacter cavernae TaxID=2817681 RepID=A0A939HCN0_9MICC|nr:hypothetical protein [Arthrobacter cavernae]MBO1266719.1 hypothetical protein [Arthrobacter cavernae]